MGSLDILFTDYFRILNLMHDYQVIIDGEKFSKITQVEISEKLGISKVTVNHMMKELKSKKFIIKEEGKIGKYYLSNEAVDIVEKFKMVTQRR